MARTIPKSLVESQRTVGFNRSLPKFQLDTGNTAQGFGAIKGMADRYANILLAEAKKDAIAQGKDDALSQEMIRDEDGNLRPITAPEGGGQYYNEAFEDVAEKRYIRRFGTDFEDKARELALDPELASDPVAYNKALTRHGNLALNAAQEEYKGILGDGVAAVIGKYTTDAQVKKFNREYAIGKQETADEIAASTNTIYQAAVAGRPLTQDQRNEADEIAAAGAAYGLSYNVERALSIADGVYAPVHSAAKNMTPRQLAELEVAIRSQDVSKLPGVDHKALASMGVAQRRALAVDIAGLRRLAVDGLDSAALAVGNMSAAEKTASPALKKNNDEVLKREGVVPAVLHGLQHGVLQKGRLSDLVFLAGADDPSAQEAKDTLLLVMKAHRVGSDAAINLTRNLSDEEKHLMRTLGDLGSDGVTTLFESMRFVAANGEDQWGFKAWSDRNKDALNTGLKEVEQKNHARIKRLAWRKDTSAKGDNFDGALKTAITKVNIMLGVDPTSYMSAHATGVVEELGGKESVMNWMISQSEDASEMQRVDFQLREEARNSAEEVVFSLYARDEAGESNWIKVQGTDRTLQQLQDGMRLPDSPPLFPWDDKKPRMVDYEEPARAAQNMRAAITVGLSDTDTGAAIGNGIQLDKGLDLGAVGAAAKKYYALGKIELEREADNKDRLTPEEQAGLSAAIIGRQYPGFISSSGELNRANPPEIKGLRGITRGLNDGYAGFNEITNTYMMRGAIKAEDEYVAIAGPEAIARLPAATAKSASNNFLEAAEGAREVRQLSDIKFHYERGGDLVDRDRVLSAQLGHMLLRNHLHEDIVPAVRDLAYVSKLKPNATSSWATHSETWAYILKELGAPGMQGHYMDKWDRTHAKGDVGDVSKTVIDFVERIKAFAFTPVGPLKGIDMIEPDKDAPSPLSETGMTIERISIASEAQRLGVATEEEQELLAKVRAGER